MQYTLFNFIFILFFVWDAVGVKPVDHSVFIRGQTGLMQRWTLRNMKRQVPEELISDKDELEWQKNPTWYAQYSVDQVAEFLREKNEEQGTYGACLALAEQHYRWLMEPLNRGQYTDTDGKPRRTDPWHRGSNILTISVMYDPHNKWYFASTVPRKPVRAIMEATAASEYKYAPAWWRAFKGKDGGLSWAHAEDGVYYNYEISNKAKVELSQYPDGSVIASATGYRDKLPKEIAACEARGGHDGTKNGPNCQVVAWTLNVQWSRVFQLPEKVVDGPAVGKKSPDERSNDLTTRGKTSIEGYPMAQIEKWISILFQERMSLDGKTCPVGKPKGANSNDKHALLQRAARNCIIKPPFPVQTFIYTSDKASKPTSSQPKSTKTATKTKPASKSSSKMAKPTPSCSYVPKGKSKSQKTAHCLCNKTKVMPLLNLKTKAVPAKSCHYTALPTRRRKRDEFGAALTTEPSITATASAEKQDPAMTTTW